MHEANEPRKHEEPGHRGQFTSVKQTRQAAGASRRLAFSKNRHGQAEFDATASWAMECVSGCNGLRNSYCTGRDARNAKP
jgi:hypothetical protein